MNKRILVVGAASLACACLSPLAALAESECMSMAGSFNEGAHESFSLNRFGDTTLTGINSQSGGIYGTGASSMTGGPNDVPQNTESGGTFANGSHSVSGGALGSDKSASESSMPQIWNPDRYASVPVSTSNNSSPRQTQAAQVAARVPVMQVTTYHWKERPRNYSRYASRSSHTM
jgi:hypothetical protein